MVTAEDTAKQPNEVMLILSLIADITVLLLRWLWAFTKAFLKLIFPTPMKSVKGEVVLITGAGHGIGRELAFQYASNGATVVCWDINQPTNQNTVEKIAKMNCPKAYAYMCDVTKRDKVFQTAAKVQREVGNVTVLINNAGILLSKSLLNHTADEIQQTMEINTFSHFWTIQAFLPAMIKNNHGHIVAISSLAAMGGCRNIVPYGASKFAVRGLMEGLYQELRVHPKSQIRLTTIYPFAVNTGLFKAAVFKYPAVTPVLEAEDVAKRIVEVQRRNMREATVPAVHLPLANWSRLLPDGFVDSFFDFLESYPVPDA